MTSDIYFDRDFYLGNHESVDYRAASPQAYNIAKQAVQNETVLFKDILVRLKVLQIAGDFFRGLGDLNCRANPYRENNWWHQTYTSSVQATIKKSFEEEDRQAYTSSVQATIKKSVEEGDRQAYTSSSITNENDDSDEFASERFFRFFEGLTPSEEKQFFLLDHEIQAKISSGPNYRVMFDEALQKQGSHN